MIWKYAYNGQMLLFPMIDTAIFEWCRLRHRDNSLYILNEEHKVLVKYKMSVLSPLMVMNHFPCWRHQMKLFSALLAICAGNSPIAGEFPRQRPVTRSFDVFFDLRLNNRLSKQSWGWWFETLSRPLWRHCNALTSQVDSWMHFHVGCACNKTGISQMSNTAWFIPRHLFCIGELWQECLHHNDVTSNGSWCMCIKGEMSGTVCVTFTWDMYIYMSCL